MPWPYRVKYSNSDSTRGEGKVNKQISSLHFACVSVQKFNFFENLICDHKKTDHVESELEIQAPGKFYARIELFYAKYL